MINTTIEAELILNTGDEVLIENKSFIRPVIFDTTNCAYKRIKFNNCSISTFKIENLNTDVEFNFENVKFKGLFEMKTSHIGSISAQKSFFQSFIIEDCTIERDLKIYSCQMEREANIFSAIKEGIIMHDSNLLGEFTIRYGGVKTINLWKNIFTQFLHIYTALSENLVMNENSIHGDFAMDMQSEINSVFSQRNTFHQKFQLLSIHSKKEFRSKNDIFKDELFLHSGNWPAKDFDLILDEVVFEKGLKLGVQENTCKELNKLHVNFSNESGKRMLFTDLEISEIKLSSTNYSTIVTFDNITTRNLIF